MTLSSSTSRQQRKSMLPKPRPSSRISASRRITSGDTTSRIARRVPSPLLAMSYNNNGSNIPTTQAVQVPSLAAADCSSSLPAEAGLRRAGSPSSEALSSLMNHTPTPSPEVKKRAGFNVQYYPTPPASAETKHERFLKGQDGRGLGRTAAVPAAQHQGTPVVAVGAAGPTPARHLSKRPASVSTALTLTNTLSCVDNASPRDAGSVGLPGLSWKKSVLMSSKSSGKENRRPRMNTRVPPPSVAFAPTIPPRSIRRTPVAQPPSRAASSRETLPPPRSLVIRKQLPLEAAAETGTSPVRSASGASGAPPAVGPLAVPGGIQALIADIDCFAKDWTEMFDELSGPLQADESAAEAGKGTSIQLPGSTVSVNALQASTPAGTSAEMVHLDLTPESLTRWQHRGKSLVKNTPEDRPERNLPAASATDLQTDKARHLLQKTILRNAFLQTIPQASRHLPSVPENDQSSVLSGSHLVETTSVVQALSNRKDDATDLSQTTSTTQRSIDTARRNGKLQQARCHSSATAQNVSVSSLSKVASLGAMSFESPYSPSAWVNLRANDFSTQCSIINATSDPVAVPTRSPSLRGLRAIFKRTSAGLTGSQRQRGESLKERIGEPRVLSLGSISISNLRDAGVASGCTLPIGKEETSRTNTGDLARIMEVK